MRRITMILMPLIVALLTFAVYLPALNNGFVNWDDNLYVYENRNIRSLGYSFFQWAATAEVAALWHPLTLFSLALDYAIWGGRPWGYHFTNILIHSLNAALVFIIAVQLIKYGGLKNYEPDKKGIIAGLVTALLFGLHPIHVESVAWISERKDVLCAFFYMLAVLAYLKYASAADFKRRIYYSLSLISFAISLMSKPMAVSLPFVLLILDSYPLGRIKADNVKKILIEKLPFFLLSILLSMATIWASYTGDALKSIERYPLLLRIVGSIHAYLFYLVKIIFPLNLAPYYPHPGQIDFSNLISFMFIMLITFLTVRLWKRNRLFLSIWFYYIITLLPVIGVVQVGGQAAADRYTYLPSLGPFLLIGLGVGCLFGSYSQKHNRIAIIVVLAIILGAISAKTVKQIGIWHDPITLWSHEIKLFPNDALAYANRGIAYGKMHNYQQAVNDFSNAIEINPRLAIAYNGRGIANKNTGNYSQAVEDLNNAIKLNPKYAEAYYNLGSVYLNMGELEKAKACDEKAASLDPGAFGKGK